jgi:iron complex transport system substrate-binding protein
MSRNSASVKALLSVAVLTLAACGNGDAAAQTTTATTLATTTAPAETTTTLDSRFPVTIESGGVTTTIESEPVAIVSLSPTATEMLFAIGAGDQVVAVDEYSYYPAEAPVTSLSGFTPNLEAIVGFEPDLVVVSDDIGGIVGALGGVGIRTLVLPGASVISDAYNQIRILGVATGRVEQAEEVASSMQSEIEALIASIGPWMNP